MSFLQIRGSIPLLWIQAPNLQLNPKIVPRQDHSENSKSFCKHVSECINNYGKTVFVNLIDKKNDQKNIGEYFNTLCRELKENKSMKINYFYFVIYIFYNKCN
jgi:hypothetical protein